jgi:hypothetical protein
MASQECYIRLPDMLAEVRKHRAVETEIAQDMIVEAHRLGDLDLKIRWPDGSIENLRRDVWECNPWHWRQIFGGIIEVERKPRRMRRVGLMEPCRIYGTRQSLDKFLGVSASKPGPAKGELKRFDEDDRALFPEVQRLMDGGKSLTAATQQLADEDLVTGIGTPESRAKRLARAYTRERGHK